MPKDRSHLRPAPITEPTAVERVVTSRGAQHKIILSAQDKHIFEQYYLSVGEGSVLANAKGSTGLPQKTYALHRLVYGEENIPNKQVIDHIDQNILNNVRSNLRAVPHDVNSMNWSSGKVSSTGYRGVYEKGDGKFEARVKGRSLGRFDTVRTALLVRVQGVLKFYGPETADREPQMDWTEEEKEWARDYVERAPERQRRASGTGGVNPIYVHGNLRWRAKLRGKIIATFETEEPAWEALDIALEEDRRKKEEERAKHAVPINGEGFVYLTAVGGEEVLVDFDTYWKFYEKKIRVNPGGYVRVGKEYLHKMVQPLPEGFDAVDHINRNKLDNTRKNLRPATRATNNRNTGEGVHYVPQYDHWVAIFKDTTVDPPDTTSKCFKTFEEAKEWKEGKKRKTYPEDYV